MQQWAIMASPSRRAKVHLSRDELGRFLEAGGWDWEERVDPIESAGALQRLLEDELDLPPDVELTFLFGAPNLDVEAEDPRIEAEVEAAVARALDALDERADEVAGALLARPRPPPGPAPDLDSIERRLEEDAARRALRPDDVEALVSALGEAETRSRAERLGARVLRATDGLTAPMLPLLAALRGAKGELDLVLDLVRGASVGPRVIEPEVLLAATRRLSELRSVAVLPALLERIAHTESPYVIRNGALGALALAFRGTAEPSALEAVLALGVRYPVLRERGDVWRAARAIGGLDRAREDELLAAWPDGTLEKMRASWTRRGWGPPDVARILQRHGVPTEPSTPEGWPPTGDLALEALLGARFGAVHVEGGQAEYERLRDAVVRLIPEDEEELHEILDEECELGLDPGEINEAFERIGSPERILALEWVRFPTRWVLAPADAFAAAAAELEIPLAGRSPG